MAKIKLCGMRREQDIDYVNEVMPDYAGFIMAPKFWRHITLEKLTELSAKLDSSIMPVAVFVNQTEEFVASVVDSGAVKMIQLHGDEDAGFAGRVREKMRTDNRFEVIKAVKVKSKDDIKAAADFPCDYLLLDAYSEETAGGTGKTFDWNLINDILDRRSFFLAGGLNPQNIQTAIDKVNPYAVDVSSGVETDKVKDIEKMRKLVKAVRRL